MKTTAYFLARYVDLANKYGWYNYRLFFFRLQHWYDEELQLTIDRTRNVRKMFKNGHIPTDSDLRDLQGDSQ